MGPSPVQDGSPDNNASLVVIFQRSNGRRELQSFERASLDHPRHVLRFLERHMVWPHTGDLAACDRVLRQMRRRTGNARGGNARGGFRRGDRPEQILGVTTSSHGLFVLIKFEGVHVPEIVTASQAHRHCPQLLIDYYYHEIIMLDTSDLS